MTARTRSPTRGHETLPTPAKLAPATPRGPPPPVSITRLISSWIFRRTSSAVVVGLPNTDQTVSQSDYPLSGVSSVKNPSKERCFSQ